MQNSRAFRPAQSDQHQRQLALPVLHLPATAEAMRDVLLVWSGQREPALTAGWLALPSNEGPNFYAVEQLWWDEPRHDTGRVNTDDGAPTADGFADQPAPTPQVRLKARRQSADGQHPS